MLVVVSMIESPNGESDTEDVKWSSDQRLHMGRQTNLTVTHARLHLSLEAVKDSLCPRCRPCSQKVCLTSEAVFCSSLPESHAQAFPLSIWRFNK